MLITIPYPNYGDRGFLKKEYEILNPPPEKEDGESSGVTGFRNLFC